MKNNNTFTKTSFDYLFPINKDQAKSELTHLNQTINDLKKDAPELLERSLEVLLLKAGK